MISLQETISLLSKRGKKLASLYDCAYNKGIESITEKELSEIDKEINSSIHIVLKETKRELTLSQLILWYYNASTDLYTIFTSKDKAKEDERYNQFIILTIYGASFKEAFETSLNLKEKTYD